jgi:hypothetical protein
VSDAGQDPACSFEDLGNAIRRVRVDFGGPVEFAQRFRILPRSPSAVGAYCAVGKVRYSAVDATAPEEDSDLIYIKPALDCGAGPDPCDVYSYKVASEEFPHEATADQWFSEAQFERYRAPGSCLISLVGQKGPVPDLAALKQRFEGYIKGRGAQPPSSAPSQTSGGQPREPSGCLPQLARRASPRRLSESRRKCRRIRSCQRTSPPTRLPRRL